MQSENKDFLKLAKDGNEEISYWEVLLIKLDRDNSWKGARVVEWVALEKRCPPLVDRGFESLSFRGSASSPLGEIAELLKKKRVKNSEGYFACPAKLYTKWRA